MRGDHIFVASGDACPICTALAGQYVDPGFKPHDHCNCDTIPRKGGGKCKFEYTENEFTRENGVLMVSMTLTITCPDGSVLDDRTYTAPVGSVLDGGEDTSMEAWAQEACDEDCPDDGGSGEDDEFLCC